MRVMSSYPRSTTYYVQNHFTSLSFVFNIHKMEILPYNCEGNKRSIVPRELQWELVRAVLEKQHVTYSYHLHQLCCLCWKDWLLPLGSKHEGMHTVPLLLHPRQDYSLLSFPLSYKPQEVGCLPSLLFHCRP